MVEWQFKLTPDILEKSPKHIIISKEVKTYRSYTSIYFDKDYLNVFLKKDYHYYELLPENLPRKFYVDIDIKPSHKNYMIFTYDDIINDTLLILKDCFDLFKWDFNIKLEDIYVCITKNSNIKQSLHINYPIYFKTQKDIKYFSCIIKYLLTTQKDKYKSLINDDEIYLDPNVYSKNQNMRCVYQSKLNKDNMLIPYKRSNELPCDYLIGIYNEPEKYDYIESLKVEKMASTLVGNFYCKDKLSNSKSEKLTSLVCAYFNELESLNVYDNIISNYEVKTDIEFYLSCIPNSNEKPQNYQMWYSIGQALKNLQEEYPNLNLLNLWIEWSLKASKIYPNDVHRCNKMWKEDLKVRETGNKYKLPFLQKIANLYCPNQYQVFKTQNLCNDFFSLKLTKINYIDIYNNNNILDTKNGFCKPINFDDIDIYVESSPMGSGKTTQILNYIKHLESQKDDNTYLLISSRKTFSKEKTHELKAICPDFIEYTDKEAYEYSDWSDIKRFSIQVESLHKMEYVDENKKRDLLMLDELESILYQMSSPTNKTNSMQNFDIFLNLIKNSKKIIAADAFLSNRSIALLNHLNLRSRVSINKFRKKDRKVIILGNAKNSYDLINVKKKFVAHIIKSLEANKKICVVVASQKFKNNIVSTLKNRFGEDFKFKIKEYDSTSDDSCIEDLTNVDENWGDDIIRLIIYTPKITIGVSYNKKDVDSVYIYGTSISSIPRDIIQAHFRVRHIKENKIYLAMFSGTPLDINPTIEEETIKNTYLDNEFSRNTCIWSNPYHEKVYKDIRDHNSLEEYISKWNYEKVIMSYLIDIGYDIEYDNTKLTEDITIATYITEVEEYHTMKLTKKEEIVKIENKIKRGSSSKNEKMIVEAYNFYNYIVLRTSFNNYNNAFNEFVPDLTKEVFEKNSFNLYISDKMFNIFIKNIISEVYFKISNKNELKLSVINDQKQFKKLCFIKKISQLLELPYTFVPDLLISTENMIKVFNYYNNLPKIEKEIFNDVFTLPSLDCKKQSNAVKKLVSSCLNNWCGLHLKTCESKRSRLDGKDERYYTYELICNNLILNCWRYFINFEFNFI